MNIEKSTKELDIPFLGIISKENYEEHYNFAKAKENDFHHTFCLSEEGLKHYDNDDTLRFFYMNKAFGNGDENKIVIEGNPALDPFNTGRNQLKTMARLFLEAGVGLSVPIYVENHYLNTKYEGKIIGLLLHFL